jgi:hypothetical protein
VTTVSAGAVTITASSEGKIAAASITITDAVVTPPPPSGTSNEPSGMSLLAERPFSSLSESPNAGLSLVQDANAPKSPSGVLRATYQSGFGGGSAPGWWEISHSGRRVLYVSYWAKLSSNFDGHLTGINKQFYEWADGKPIFYFEAYGVGSASLAPRVVLQGTPRDAVYSPNLVTNAVIPRGQWYRVEILLTGNTSGSANGAVDWWLNGVHVGSVTSGVQFTPGTTSWNLYTFRPIWGGLGDAVPSTMTLDMDHLYMSGKN